MQLEGLLLAVILKLGSLLVLVMISIGGNDGMSPLEIIRRFSTDSVGLVREGAYSRAELSSLVFRYKFEQIGFLHSQE